MVLWIVDGKEEFTLRRTIVAGRSCLRRKKPKWDTINQMDTRFAPCFIGPYGSVEPLWGVMHNTLSLSDTLKPKHRLTYTQYPYSTGYCMLFYLYHFHMVLDFDKDPEGG